MITQTLAFNGRTRDEPMAAPTPGTYHHTQRAPLGLVLFAIGALLLLNAWLARAETPIPLVLGGVGLLMLLLSACFAHLTVSDEGPWLAVRFGPLPLFQTRLAYNEMQAIEKGRTTVLEGWGIHLSPRGGWVWNLGGFDCGVVRRARGVIRIGSDDAANLAAFLDAVHEYGS